MIQVKLVAHDDDVVQMKTVGRVVPEVGQNDNEPIAKALGRDAYSRRVLLSLEDSDYMDSSGVGWLLSCHKKFREGGGTLVVHSVPKMVEQILKLLRLDAVLRIAPSLETARELATAEKTA